VRTRRRGEEMVKVMGGGQVVVLRGHGLTTAAPTLQGAVATALSVNVLATMTVSLASAGRDAEEVPAADRAELPDLGASFNDDLIWRHHVAKLAYRGLAVDL
ncbi:MAG: class II aldolase/adducin family protein, partial [Acidimicrobiales bacterium]